MWPFFNPTIEVATFCLRGWCMLGVFLLPAFARPRHECALKKESVRWNARVHRLDLGLTEFWSNGVITPVNSKEKSLCHDAASSRTVNPPHHQRAIPEPLGRLASEKQKQHLDCFVPGLARSDVHNDIATTYGELNRGATDGWRWYWYCWCFCLFVGCLTSQQHASVSQGQICSDNLTCCHTEIEVAGQTFHLTQSQYTDTGPTSLSTDPLTPGAWQGGHWSDNFLSHWYDSTPEKYRRKRDSNPGSSALEAHALTTRPTRRSIQLMRLAGVDDTDVTG